MKLFNPNYPVDQPCLLSSRHQFLSIYSLIKFHPTEFIAPYSISFKIQLGNSYLEFFVDVMNSLTAVLYLLNHFKPFLIKTKD